MSNYLERPLHDFLADTAANQPTPGGGSVAAMTGAMGTALFEMTVRYAIGSAKRAEFHDRLMPLADQLKRSRRMFQQLMGEDMAAYGLYAESRKKESVDDADARLAESAAIAVPLEVLTLAARVAAWAPEAKGWISPMLVSDLIGAVALLEGSARAAAATLRSNLKHQESLNDSDRTELESSIDRALAELSRVREATD